MKRSALVRRTPLKRPARRALTHTEQTDRAAWKDPKAGPCSCGCDRWSMHLERHHIVYEQHVRAESGNPWDLANSMLLHPHCHRRHHDAVRRIPIERLPVPAVRFAMALFGEEAASEYLRRRYNCRESLPSPSPPPSMPTRRKYA